MSLFCLGLNHKTTPVELRERLAFAEKSVPEAAQQLAQHEGLGEAVVLSTCNRVELYVASPAEGVPPQEAQLWLEAWLRERAGLSTDEAERVAYYHLAGASAARHLFEVVSGLDSLVLGETEIFGQVKKAYATAQAAGATGGRLNRLFQRAFSVGKLVRSQTGIQTGVTSVGQAAVELAEKIFGDLRACEVMLLGAGEISRATAKSLVSRGAASLIVSNRSHDRAVELAAEMNGRALRFDEWESAVTQVDIIIASTAAPHFVVKAEQIAQAMRARRGRPLFIIDIAVPRDVEPTVNDLDGVYLYDIDALELIADQGRQERAQQIDHCRLLIERQLEKFGYLAASEPAALAKQNAVPASV